MAPALTRGYVYQGEKDYGRLDGRRFDGSLASDWCCKKIRTTGGLDIVGRMVKKKMPQFSIGKIMFAGRVYNSGFFHAGLSKHRKRIERLNLYLCFLLRFWTTCYTEWIKV